MRILHRDIGYFLTGITMVYALSGIFLTHKDIFPSLSEEKHSFYLPAGLQEVELEKRLQKDIGSCGATNTTEKGKTISFYVENGNGDYNVSNGLVRYRIYKTKPVIRFLNQLHFNNKRIWPYIADTFAGALIFLAVSGLIIVPGKKGFLSRGIWFMLPGFAMVLAFIWID